MTSIKTKKLKISAVSSVPKTPVISTSVSGTKNGSREYPLAAANHAHTTASKAVVVSMSAENMSAANGMPTREPHSPSREEMADPSCVRKMSPMEAASAAPKMANRTTCWNHIALRKMMVRPAPRSGTPTNSGRSSETRSMSIPSGITTPHPCRYPDQPPGGWHRPSYPRRR